MTAKRCLTLIIAASALLSPMTGHGQDWVKDREAFGKHRQKVEARAQAKGLVLEYDTRPQVVKITQPKYPAEAFRNRVQGTVVVMITIDVDGRVQDPEVLESVSALDEAALTCTKRWRFKPAMKGGQAVATAAVSPITFRIER
jgi:protein TonB